jgi:hypothetical protein
VLRTLKPIAPVNLRSTQAFETCCRDEAFLPSLLAVVLHRPYFDIEFSFHFLLLFLLLDIARRGQQSLNCFSNCWTLTGTAVGLIRIFDLRACFQGARAVPRAPHSLLLQLGGRCNCRCCFHQCSQQLWLGRQLSRTPTQHTQQLLQHSNTTGAASACRHAQEEEWQLGLLSFRITSQ